jgi:hypothetical protein
MTTSVAYPIIFTITDMVHATRFLAGVTACGRALMVREESGDWWLYGVEPGGLAESGDSPEGAYGRFAEAFRGILSDIALEVHDFASFSARVQAFFYESDPSDNARWERAVEDLRSGALKPEPTLTSQVRLPAETPRLIRIEPLNPAAARPTRHETLAIPFAA